MTNTFKHGRTRDLPLNQSLYTKNIIQNKKRYLIYMINILNYSFFLNINFETIKYLLKKKNDNNHMTYKSFTKLNPIYAIFFSFVIKREHIEKNPSHSLKTKEILKRHLKRHII